MKKPIYTARARVTGGRVGGRGRTGDGTLDARLRLPKALGGAGDGANPEQLFAIGYAGCFEAAMTVAAQRLGVPRAQVTDVAIEAKVMLLARDDRRFELGVELVVELPSLTDQALAAEVVRATHQLCPYSNPIRGERRRRADGQRRRRKRAGGRARMTRISRRLPAARGVSSESLRCSVRPITDVTGARHTRSSNGARRPVPDTV